METERYFSTAVSKRLGCVIKFERCFPPHFCSSAIKEVFGFPFYGHDLSVRGSAFRPLRLAKGLDKCSDSPGVRVQGALGASSSDDPAMDPGSGIPGVLEEVFSGSAEAPFFSRVSAGRPGFGISPAVAWLPPSFG